MSLCWVRSRKPISQLPPWDLAPGQAEDSAVEPPREKENMAFVPNPPALSLGILWIVACGSDTDLYLVMNLNENMNWTH